MERLNKIKGAVFDLDGTLLESMGVWADVDKLFLQKRGIDMPADYVEAVTPLGLKAAAEYTVKRFCLAESADELMREWHDMIDSAYKKDIKLKPFAVEYLLQLKNSGVKLATASALGQELCEAVLKSNGIYGLFDAIATVADVKRGKGFPDIYLYAAKKLALKPGECAVFEDILLGVKGAKDGGFISVGVYDKFSDYEKEEILHACDYYIHSFNELLNTK